MLQDLALPTTLETRGGPVTLRRSAVDDLDALMRLLSEDPISASRGDKSAEEDRPRYLAALEAVIADPSNEIVLAVGADGDESGLVGTMQLTRIPGMSRRGSTRLLVEAVRVSSVMRSAGIGSAMMRWVTDVAAPGLGATLVQLTSDSARADAHRFYERLGFVASHVGFKYAVPQPAEGAVTA